MCGIRQEFCFSVKHRSLFIKCTSDPGFFEILLLISCSPGAPPALLFGSEVNTTVLLGIVWHLPDGNLCLESPKGIWVERMETQEPAARIVWRKQTRLLQGCCQGSKIDHSPERQPGTAATLPCRTAKLHRNQRMGSNTGLTPEAKPRSGNRKMESSPVTCNSPFFPSAMMVQQRH